MPVKKRGGVKGLKEMKQNFAGAKISNRKAVVRGITKWALLVKRRSIPAAPIRLGNLRNSGYTVVHGVPDVTTGAFTGNESGAMASQHQRAKAESDAKSASMSSRTKVVGVVGYSAVYAAAVHELPSAGAAGYDPTLDDPALTAEKVHSKVGGWQYLRNPLNGSRREGLAILANEIRKANG